MVVEMNFNERCFHLFQPRQAAELKFERFNDDAILLRDRHR